MSKVLEKLSNSNVHICFKWTHIGLLGKMIWPIHLLKMVLNLIIFLIILVCNKYLDDINFRMANPMTIYGALEEVFFYNPLFLLTCFSGLMDVLLGMLKR